MPTKKDWRVFKINQIDRTFIANSCKRITLFTSKYVGPQNEASLDPSPNQK
jgi:hypothetical protein